jgi:hypothetical protein
MKLNNSDGFLPLLFAVLPEIVTAIGGLTGGGETIAKAVNGAKHQRAEEEEMKRHNKEMEKMN